MLFHFTTPVWAWGSQDGYEYFWADSTRARHYKLLGGLSTIYYSWYNPNNYTTYNGSSYHVPVVNGANSWDSALSTNPGTDFISTSYTNSNTRVYYMVSDAVKLQGVFAGCIYYNSNGVMVSDGENLGAPWADYSYVYVICYNYNMNRPNNTDAFYHLSDTEVKGVMAHEMGHAMGLAHVEPDGFHVLMEDDHINDYTYAPTSYDVAGIRNAGY